MKSKLYFALLLLVHCVNSVHALDAHVHGVVNLDIAVDKTEMLIIIKSPSDSFLGFEYKAKVDQEKGTVLKVKDFFTKTPFRIFNEEELKKCIVTNSSWKQEFSGENHSSLIIEAYLKCPFKLEGKSLSLSIFDTYPKIKSVHLQVLSENLNYKKILKDKRFKIKI